MEVVLSPNIVSKGKNILKKTQEQRKQNIHKFEHKFKTRTNF